METPGGLPPGVSIQQASGLRPMFRVTILLLAASLYLAATAAGAFAQAQNFTPRDESPEEFPAGAGREETFYACTACHGFKLISQQGMNRRQWDDTLNWMTTKHGMPALEGKDRELVLNYLEATYPPRSQERGWQNPFLNR
jgi:mono/diheme cytochrome c family protein